MGMSIDEILLELEEAKDYPVSNEAIDYAISTIHKYHKIVDIVSLNGEEFKQCGLKELKEILEVIANGNDD